MAEVTLFRRRHCGLCDDALFELRRLSRELKFTIVECDIDDDATLAARYNELVPVIAVGEREIDHAPIDLVRLRSRLDAAIAPSERRAQHPQAGARDSR